MQKEHCAVRLGAEDIARVDALAELMSTEHVEVRRSGALRALIMAALPVLESTYQRGAVVAQRNKGGRK